MSEITYREVDCNELSAVAEAVRDQVDGRLKVSLARAGAVRIDGCRASLLALITMGLSGDERRSFQVLDGDRSLGVFPGDRLADAVAVVLSTAAVPRGVRSMRMDIGDWRAIAARLAARKAARISA